MKYHEIKAYARKLRNNPTAAESELWVHIRKKQLSGRKFLRQHPIMHQISFQELFYYIPDFYCHAEKLIIELDGSIHETRIEEDKQRQTILENMGFTVLRFKNQELNDIEQVLKTITNHF